MMIKLECEEQDAPESADLFCWTEKEVRVFRRKLKGTRLMGYVCTVCYNVVHPISLVISGTIIEGKWRGIKGDPYKAINK